MTRPDKNPFARLFPYLLAWAALLWCVLVVMFVGAHALMDYRAAMDLSFAMIGVIMVAGLVPMMLCAIGMLLHDISRHGPE